MFYCALSSYVFTSIFTAQNWIHKLFSCLYLSWIVSGFFHEYIRFMQSTVWSILIVCVLSSLLFTQTTLSNFCMWLFKVALIFNLITVLYFCSNKGNTDWKNAAKSLNFEFFKIWLIFFSSGMEFTKGIR